MRFQLGPGTSAMLILDSPIHGRFDSREGDTVGLYDQKTGEFFLYDDNSPQLRPAQRFVFDPGPAAAHIGPLNPVGLAGRWIGGELDTVGIYDNVTSTFQLRTSNTAGGADITFSFGAPGSIPITGDWSGKGTDTVGVYDPKTGQFQLRDGNGADAGVTSFAFGPVDAQNMWPVAGDWDGDGIDTIGVLDEANFVVYLRNSNSAGAADQTIEIERANWRWQPLGGKWRTTTAPPESPGYAWPTASPESLHIDATKLEAAFAYAKSLPFTRSLLVVRNGTLAREGYFNGNRPEIAHHLASAGKSVVSALFGVAAGDGTVPVLTTPISQLLDPAYFPDPSDPRTKITLGNLLTQTSGIEATHELSAEDWAQFSLLSKDWTQTILSLPLTHPQGTFGYNSSNPGLGAVILTGLVGESLDDFARRRLAEPLGISIPWWQHDPKGFVVGAGSLGMKPRDFARFGQLFLQHGNIDGQQIIPQTWADLSTSALVSTGTGPDSRFGAAYGMWWWHPIASGNGSDIFAALGSGGQFLYVIPSLQTIIVITCRDDVFGAELDAQYEQIFTLLGYTLGALQP